MKFQTWEKALDFRLLDLIATVIDFCAPPKEQGRGHPRSATVRVLATLRQFLREGTPWRSLKATAGKVSGSTLRRYLEQWAQIGLLAQVHAVLVGMLRGDPTLILDSCSVRAKRGGDLTGPNPTDRGKRGTKYHVATMGDGVPVACVATGVLHQVHARLIRMVRMVRGGPHVISVPSDIVVDSCSVRAKRGGDLVGPNPTDRGKPGTKYHVVVDDDGLPLAAVASAANVNDTQFLPHLLNRAMVVCANIGRLIADAGYDSRDNRECCHRYGVLPLIRARGDEHGSGLGTVRRVVENAISWLLMNKRLDRRHDRSSLILQALLTTACTFIAAKSLSQ